MNTFNLSTIPKPPCSDPVLIRLNEQLLQCYFYLIPLYILVVFVARPICLKTFLASSTQEKAYVYQIFLTSAEFLEGVATIIFIFVDLGSGVEGNYAPAWFKSSYALMFISGHLNLLLSNFTTMLVPLLSVCMAADRAFALGRPMKYRNLKHSLHQKIALACSIFIAAIFTAQCSFVLEVQTINGVYEIRPSISYRASGAAAALGTLGNMVRLLGLVALVTCNLAVIRFHRQYISNLVKLMNGRIRDEKLESEKATERILLMLTLSQSFFVAITTAALFVITSLYAMPSFECEMRALWPLISILVMCCDLLSACMTLALLKKVRRGILKFFRPFMNIFEAGTMKTAGTVNNITLL